MSMTLSATDWEAMYAPYDQSTYEAALEMLKPGDVVLDVGAGDLGFSRQMARIADKVYAVETSSCVLQSRLTSRGPLPDNLIPICADAKTLDFPVGITVGVLLMRHCTHFRLYLEKLHTAGARRLITNARWRMSVEQVDLQGERMKLSEVGMGWYACLCGATGFKAGPAEQWSTEMDERVHEVANCPQCSES
jgi:hypothetical protein